MLKFRKKSLFLILSLIAIGLVCSFFAYAQDMEKYIPDSDGESKGMTLWQIIKAGGEVMLVLAFLSIVATGLIVYYFMFIKFDTLLPVDFCQKAEVLIEERRFEEADKLCSENENIISGIISAGLSRQGRKAYVVKEAIEDEGRRAMDSLRQRLSYLADVAAISPMVGLLGTVLGMIQAFNVIAFQTGAVKPILLASGISKAMITTAVGLIIAIPAMIFYSFFRGKVQDISARLENISMEFYHLIVKEDI